MNLSALRNLKLQHPGILLDDREILLIANAIGEFPRCNLLVFGMGNDSQLWMDINARGRTAFLEDNRDWYNRVMETCPAAEACLVTYNTVLSQWEEIMDDESRLAMELPSRINGTRWDVILVDGPSGDLPGYRKRYGVEPPGRMCSIYMSSRLVNKNGYVFVHDCNRIVERVYADRYLFDVNLVEQTRTVTQLRKYRIP